MGNQDFGDRVADKAASGIVGCLTGAGSLGTVYLLSGLTDGIARVVQPPPAEEQILNQKPEPAFGVKISGVTCSHCGKTTEDGQPDCHFCGRSLRPSSPTIEVGGISHLQVQWGVFLVMAVLGLVIALSSNPQLSCLGAAFLLASLGWGITLLRPTLINRG